MDKDSNSPEEVNSQTTILPIKKTGRVIRALAQGMKEKKLAAKKKEALRLKNAKQAWELDRFMEEFLHNGGDATQAAIKAFNLTSKSEAAKLGTEFVQKAKELARVYLEQNGTTYGRFLQIAVEKMEGSKNPEWWDRLMELTGYRDFITKEKKNTSPSIVQIIGAQKEMIRDYVEGEIVEDKHE